MGEANFPKRSVQLSNCCISSFVLYFHSFSIFSFFLPCLSWALEVPDNAQCPVKVLARDAATKGWRCGEQRFLRCRGETGAWGRCPESSLASATPLLSHLCVFYVPFVNEDLVKSLQRKGRKNFLISILAVRTGMKGDRLIEGQNVFLFLYFTFYRLGILELKRL